MTEPNYSVSFTASMQAASACAVGNALAYDASSGYWVVATSANRTSLGKRTEAIALTAYGGSAVGKVAYQTSGTLPASVSGLSSGYAGKRLVRVSTTGTLERIATASVNTSTDDIVGYAETDGRVHLYIGFPFDELVTIVAAGGGAPTGAQYVTLATNSTLSAERVLTAGDGISLVDAGAGSTLTVHGPRGVCTLEQYGAVGDGVTSDNAAMASAISALNAGTYGTLLLGADRTYLLTAAHTITAAGVSVIGQGHSSVLKTATDAGVLVVSGEDCHLSKFKILGSSSGSSQTGIRSGSTASAGSGVSRLMVSNVELINLGANGWEYNQNPLSGGASTYLGPTLVNVTADGCAVGFRFGERGEYARLTNCHAQRCTSWGYVIGAGNVGLANCSATKNQNGIDIPHATNGSHGELIGCSINHNTTINLRYGAIYGQKLVGCSIYQGSTGAITVSADAKGLDFIGCEIDVADYSFATGATVRFLSCLFDSGYYSALTAHDNAIVIVDSPRLLDGTIPSWMRQFIQRNFTFASDADDTLTIQESHVGTLIVQDGTLTAAERRITSTRAPHAGNQQRIVNLNVYAIEFAWSSGAEVAINSLDAVLVGADGTNAIIIG